MIWNRIYAVEDPGTGSTFIHILNQKWEEPTLSFSRKTLLASEHIIFFLMLGLKPLDSWRTFKYYKSDCSDSARTIFQFLLPQVTAS